MMAQKQKKVVGGNFFDIFECQLTKNPIKQDFHLS